MSKNEHENVHLNFKVAVIAVFFFFLLFELHAPVFKPKATGYAPFESFGHWKIDRTQGCAAHPPGTQFISADKEECSYWDPLQEDIVKVKRY